MATVTYTLPIYEAVVCNLTLEKMSQEEGQERLLSLVLESIGLSKEVVRFFFESDFSTVDEDTVEQTYIALCLLVDTGRRAVSCVRNDLSTISSKYRSVMTTALDDAEATIEHLEEVCEAWSLAYTDLSTVTQIKQALDAISKNKNEKESPDWRKALATLPD